jgi:hypothetical protein
MHILAAADTNEEGLASTLEAIAKLPPSNKDTLAYLILHLQRVAYYSTANKMPLANLVTVFAPTVVGNGGAKPTDADLLRDAKHQPKVSRFQENKSLICGPKLLVLKPVLSTYIADLNVAFKFLYALV